MLCRSCMPYLRLAIVQRRPCSCLDLQVMHCIRNAVAGSLVLPLCAPQRSMGVGMAPRHKARYRCKQTREGDRARESLTGKESARTLASMRNPSSARITPSGRKLWPVGEARVMSEVLSAWSRSTDSPILRLGLRTLSMVFKICIT